MIANYESGYNVDVRERVKQRRRKLATERRSIAGYNLRRSIKKAMRLRLQRVIVIAAVCFITAMTGYIGAYNNVSHVKGLALTAQAADETIYKTVVVHKGDTLWGIAEAYTEPTKDVRKQIRVIRELNGIEANTIYPGQTILIPVPAYLA